MSNATSKNPGPSDMEMINDKLRIVISQNDKILEYVSAIYEGIASLGEEDVEEPPEGPHPAPQNMAALLESLTGGEEKKDPRTPGFGWDAHQARGGQ